MKSIELHYENKVAVVTGAASGMGLLASRELAAAGAKVVLCDVNEEALGRECSAIASDPAIGAAGGEVSPCRCDVRRWEDAEGAAELALSRFGRIDLLFCFAGGNEARCRNSHVPYLASEKGVYVTGTNHVIDGGRLSFPR